MVSKSLAAFVDMGRRTMDNFMQKRFVESNKAKRFWDPVSMTKAKTFADMRKNIASQKVHGLKADSEALFRRLLDISKQRDISLETLLKHGLAVVPLSLFNDDGTMRKTMKSELANKLEASCPHIQTLPPGIRTAYLTDGMALLPDLSESLFSTFRDIGLLIKQHLVNLMTGELIISAIVLVFDRYDNLLSIKHMERQHRGYEQRASHVIAENRQVPNCRKFMKKCTCARNGLTCIDICACNGFECGNSSHIIEAESDDDL